MKKICLLISVLFTICAFGQQGNSPYPTTNAQSYAGNPRYYISGVQGSVKGQDLNYAYITPTLATKLDTIFLFPGAWNTIIIPTDSLGNAVQSDTNVVFCVYSNYGPFGTYVGDIMRIQVCMGTYAGADTKAGISGHVLFSNKYTSGFRYTTAGDSVNRIYCTQTLYMEFQNYDGYHWIEKSHIIFGTAKN